MVKCKYTRLKKTKVKEFKYGICENIMQNRFILFSYARLARFKAVNSGNNTALFKVNSADCLVYPVLFSKKSSQAERL